MEFEFTDDQLEPQRAVRDVLDAEAPPELARAVADGESDAAGFWQTLVDLEWPAMALPESVGGLGYGWVELAIVLEELRRHAAPGPFMATVTQFAAIVAEVAAPDQAAELLAPVATGRTTGTIAVDEGSGTWDPDGAQATARRRRDGQGEHGRGPAPLRTGRTPARGGHRLHLGARPALVPAPGQGRRTPFRLGLPPPPQGRPPSPPIRSRLEAERVGE